MIKCSLTTILYIGPTNYTEYFTLQVPLNKAIQNEQLCTNAVWQASIYKNILF